MPGVVVLTLILNFEDAEDVERRAELRMLQAPQAWPTRTAALLAELGLGTSTYLVPRGVRVLTVEPEPETVPHVLPAVISEADVFAGSPGRARRRALHEAYLQELRSSEDVADTEDDLDGDDEDQDEDE